jgi:hypothetical protein
MEKEYTCSQDSTSGIQIGTGREICIEEVKPYNEDFRGPLHTWDTISLEWTVHQGWLRMVYQVGNCLSKSDPFTSLGKG